MDRRRFVVTSTAAGVAMLAGCVSGNDNDSPETSESGNDGTSETSESGNDGTSETGESGNDSTSETGEREGDSTSETGSGGLPAPLRTAIGALPEAVEGRQVRRAVVAAPERASGEANLGEDFAENIETDLGVSVTQIDWVVTAYFGEAFERMVAVATGSFQSDDVSGEGPADSLVHAEDGLVVLAGGQEGTREAGLDAALAASDDPDGGQLGTPAELALRPVTDSGFVAWTLAPQSAYSEAVDDAVEAVAVGQTTVSDQTERISYAVAFEDEASVAEETLEETLAAGGYGNSGDLDPARDGQVLSGTYTREQPGYRPPDRTPDAHFSLEEGPVLELRGDDPLDPTNLVFLVDGRSQEPPWSGRESPVEPRETFGLDVDPFATIEIRWQDPEDDDTVRSLFDSVVAPRDAFTGEYDHDAGELTITYTHGTPVSTDRLEYVSFGENGSDHPFDDARPLAELVGDTLDAGRSFTVSVAYDEFVLVLLSAGGEDDEPKPVFEYAPEPPGEFEFTVEAEFVFDYDASAGTLTVTHGGGAPLDAEQLSLQVWANDEPLPVGESVWADEYDQVTPGDSVVVEFDETIESGYAAVLFDGLEVDIAPLPDESHRVVRESVPPVSHKSRVSDHSDPDISMACRK